MIVWYHQFKLHTYLDYGFRYMKMGFWIIWKLRLGEGTQDIPDGCPQAEKLAGISMDLRDPIYVGPILGRAVLTMVLVHWKLDISLFENPIF